MRESKIERDAVKLVLDNLGIRSSKLVTPGDTGYPDRIIWVPGGKPLLVEYKVPGENLRPKQIYIHELLKSLNYNVQVHDYEIETLEAVIRIVETHKLSKAQYEVLAAAKRRCAVLRSRTR